MKNELTRTGGRCTGFWSALAETLDMDLFGLSELATMHTLGHWAPFLLDLDERASIMVASRRTMSY